MPSESNVRELSSSAAAMDHVNPALEQFVVTAVAQACNLEPAALSREAHAMDIGLDCLAIMSVMSQVEAAFGIRCRPVHTRELFAAATVDEFISAVQMIAAAQSISSISQGEA